MIIIKVRLISVDFIFYILYRKYTPLLLVSMAYHFLLPHPLYNTVMVNFVCQLDWAMGAQFWLDVWLNIILGVSVRMLLDEINI